MTRDRCVASGVHVCLHAGWLHSSGAETVAQGLDTNRRCVCAFRGPAQASPVLVEEGLSHATAARIDRDRTTPCYVHLCAQVCGEQSTLRQRYEGALESKTQTISHLRRELKEARKAAGQVRNRAARQWDSRAGARTVCCGRHPAAGKL